MIEIPRSEIYAVEIEDAELLTAIHSKRRTGIKLQSPFPDLELRSLLIDVLCSDEWREGNLALERILRIGPSAESSALLEIINGVAGYRESARQVEVTSRIRNVSSAPCKILVDTEIFPDVAPQTGEVTDTYAQENYFSILQPGEEIELIADRALQALHAYDRRAWKTRHWVNGAWPHDLDQLREVAYHARWVENGRPRETYSAAWHQPGEVEAEAPKRRRAS